MTNDNLRLTWSATPSPNALAISYKIENTGAQVWVASKLSEGGTDVDRLVVMNGADVIRLVRGVVMPDGARVLDVPPAIFVPLPAGGSLEAKVELAVPLVGWHNAGPVAALRPAKNLVLEIAYTETEGGPQKWLVGDPLPAP